MTAVREEKFSAGDVTDAPGCNGFRLEELVPTKCLRELGEQDRDVLIRIRTRQVVVGDMGEEFQWEKGKESDFPGVAQGQDGGTVSVDSVLKILGQSRERQQVLGKRRRGSCFFLGGESTGGLQRTGVLRWIIEK